MINYKNYWVTDTTVTRKGINQPPNKDGKYLIDGELLTIKDIHVRHNKPETMSDKPIINVGQSIKEVKPDTNVGHNNRAELMKGENNPNFKGYYIIDGIKYASCESASLKLNIPARKLLRWCKSSKSGYSFQRA